MPYIDATGGISFYGGMVNSDGKVTEIDCNIQACGNFGLVFLTYGSGEVHNVTVVDVAISRFHLDGLQVCAGYSAQPNGCFENVSNITLQNVSIGTNGNDGINILGKDVSAISIGGGTSAENDFHKGLEIQASGTLSGVELDGFSSSGHEDKGISLVSAQPMSDITITGGHYYGNAGVGIFTQGTTTHAIQLTNVLVDTNDGTGIQITSVGGSIFNVHIDGMSSNSNGGSGIEINASAGLSDTHVTGSSASGNSIDGLYLHAGPGLSSTTVTGGTYNSNGAGIDVQVTGTSGSLAGVTIDGNTVQNNTLDGITLNNFGSAVGVPNTVTNNIVSGNDDGIDIAGPIRVTISHNQTFSNNALGINLETPGDGADHVTLNDAGDGDSGPNDLLNYPEFDLLTPQSVTGFACAMCKVEVFVADPDPSNHGEGKTFLGEATADANGEFTVSLCALDVSGGAVGLTATATNQAGSTSEFSQNEETLNTPPDCATATPTPSPTPSPTAVHTPTPSAGPTPSPTPTLAPGELAQGDLNCDGKVDAGDALLALIISAGFQQSPISGCPPIGTGSPKFGDVDCKGSVDPQDALAILGYAAGATPLDQHEPCTNIGAALPS
ncbi:MAG: hypothetical protein ABI559_01820 [Chloroflexota bacterium]